MKETQIYVLWAGKDFRIQDKYTGLLKATPGLSLAPLNPHPSSIDAALFLLSPNFFLETACRIQSVEIIRQRPDLVKKGWVFAILIGETLMEIPGDGAVRLLFDGKVPRSEAQRLAGLREMLTILASERRN